MAHLLVIGASRGVGKATVERALARGHRVRALARSIAEFGIEHPDLERVAGSALDPETLENALDGIDAVIVTLGAPASLSRRPVTLFSRSAERLIPAMHRAGIRRLVMVTGIGAGNSRGIGGFFYNRIIQPLLLARIYADKDRAEALVQDSGLDWVIVRPGFLTDGRFMGRVKALTDPVDWRGGRISRLDVGDFLVRATEEDAWLGTTPLLIW